MRRSLIAVILPCFCQQPVQPQHYYGPNFGYIVAFRPFDNKEWRKVMVADPLARSYIHKDLALPPLTKFQVKVKAFNSKGEGPFSLTAVIYSAQDGESGTDSQLSLPTLFSSVSAPQRQQRRCSRTYLTGISRVWLRGILIPLESVAIFPSRGADYHELRRPNQRAHNSPKDAKHLAHLLTFTDRQLRYQQHREEGALRRCPVVIVTRQGCFLF